MLDLFKKNPSSALLYAFRLAYLLKVDISEVITTTKK